MQISYGSTIDRTYEQNINKTRPEDELALQRFRSHVHIANGHAPKNTKQETSILFLIQKEI